MAAPTYEDILRVCADASLRDASVRVDVDPENPDGDPMVDLGIALNLLLDDLQTQREEALRSERERAELAKGRYEFLAAILPLQLWRTDTEGRVNFASQRTLRYLGVDPTVVSPELDWYEGVHPDDRARLAEQWQTALAERREFTAEVRLRSAEDGSYRWFAVRAAPWSPRPGVIEWFGSNTDVDDLYRARAAAEQASAAKARFLSSMSHELRTPMNAVIGLTGAMMAEDLPDTQRDYLLTIRRSGDHLLSVINDILDYSKIEAGELGLERYEFDLPAELESTMEIAAPPALEKGVDIAMFVDAEVPRRALGDPGRLRQVLLNLLGNAVKFTTKGEVTLHVRAQRRGEAEVELVAAVRDTGPGIAGADLGRLFKPFSQLGEDRKARAAGTGLGLTISRQLCQLMGGDIAVSSEPGRGSTFTARMIVGEAGADPEPGAEFAGQAVHVLAGDSASTRALVAVIERGTARALVTGSAIRLLSAVCQGTELPLAIVIDEASSHDDLADVVAALLRERAELRGRLLVLTTGPQARRVGEVELRAIRRPVRASQVREALGRCRKGTSEADARGRGEYAEDAGLATSFPRRILLVEDNPMNQKVARILLGRFGYTADVAGNGEEAVRQVSTVPYDLVLMDVEMPVMDGLTATREIKRICGERAPRIVGVTANVMREDREACAAAGMDDFLGKPVSIDSMRAMFHRLRGEQAGAPRAEDQEFTVDLLAAVLGLDPEEAATLVELFCEQCAELGPALEAGLAAGDAATVHRLVHDLVSTAGQMGATGLARLARELQQLARRGDLRAIREARPRLLHAAAFAAERVRRPA